MLTDRQLLILKVLVDEFIHSAQPVGSRSLSKNELIRLSSATIRNEMAELEEKGFIEKTHSSSGRVPSQKGYRFYVDYLLNPAHLEREAKLRIQKFVEQEQRQLEQIVTNTADLLSEITNYTAIALGPEAREQSLRKIQVVPLSSFSAVMILVTSTGTVYNQMVTLPPGVEPSELEKFVNIVNERLIGSSISKLMQTIEHEVHQVFESHVKNYKSLLQLLFSVSETRQQKNVYHVSGKTKMLNQPEFLSLDKVREYLEMIERENQLTEIVKHQKSGLSISIGKENNISFLEDYSLVTATYGSSKSNQGTIAILGPTRMEYAKVVPLLNYFSHMLTEILNKRE
ncbi:MAG TPA: heat-inducible transcriptional repressor HrcA [Firmicutes bacterium]|nr:heat-inducible transcription repressor HrcA [Bacillales bacterium]HJA41284.1 heat-inducible transcriptional repressor HrcA [Bacillota bacterium]